MYKYCSMVNTTWIFSQITNLFLENYLQTVFLNIQIKYIDIKLLLFITFSKAYKQIIYTRNKSFPSNVSILYYTIQHRMMVLNTGIAGEGVQFLDDFSKHLTSGGLLHIFMFLAVSTRKSIHVNSFGILRFRS